MNTNCAYFSSKAPVFHGRKLPEEGWIVGYAAIIDRLKLKAPIPDVISIISEKNVRDNIDSWTVYPNSYFPESPDLSEIEALYKHLVFALKYEGVNLLVFSLISKHYGTDQLTELVNIEPTGQYSRRIWFLIEWVADIQLDRTLPSKAKKSYVDAVDSTLQYTIPGTRSPRHRINNNLPGTPHFCPLIRKTKQLEAFSQSIPQLKQEFSLNFTQKDILYQAAAFLLLKDSKASFSIEGESPKSRRAARWGEAIGQAGQHNLSKNELLRLQQIVIESSRFTHLGFRNSGGFVGIHDRVSKDPIPYHISARREDLDILLDGLIHTNNLLLNTDFDPVLAAAMIAFGFVFIHPFEDGNGRIHRYLIHHILTKKHFSDHGIIFPVSASILTKMGLYQQVLEAYSKPILDFIDWEITEDKNVNVLNQTLNYYRFFDATRQAEFLYECVIDTITHIVPDEVDYLIKYQTFKTFLEEQFEMPDRKVDLLTQFLEQNAGTLSKRAREKEFDAFTEEEITFVEHTYKYIFS